MKNYLQSIKKSLEQFVGTDFPFEDVETLVDGAITKEYLRDDFFLSVGETSRKMGFVAEGLFRIYCTDTAGKDYTKNIKPAGHFMAAQASLLLRTPSRLYIQALENSIVMSVDYDMILQMAECSLCWQKLLRKQAETDYLEKEQRESDLLFLDARERYQKFRKEYSGWENKIQLRYIASYLGMSPETLSRIRKN